MKPRLAAMLALIPFAPKAVSAQDLSRALDARGFRIHPRSVQRDLQALRRFMPLRVEANAKPYLWSWASCPCGRTS